MREQLVQEFKKIFGDGGEIKVYFAPGRVNLIGEHTDYNGGHVFPCALTIGTYAVARKNDSTKLRFYSMNFDHLGILTGDVNELDYNKKDGWTCYPKGIIWTMKKRGFEIPKGMDILYFGNIPNGSGLSSSASIEVLTGLVLRDMWNLPVSNQDLALIGQYSENQYNGVNCGIMDQFAIAMGQKNKAIFLDTATLDFEYADIDLKDSKIVILNTNKKRGLGDSKYNERRAECETALAELQKVVKIHSLGELTEQQFETYKGAILDEDRKKRAKHAVYENQRTIKAVKALKQGKLDEFGQLMIASHKSLQYDYEVTGKELDTLVDAALRQEGVVGARMTGAGFGGCAVSIVKSDSIDRFIENVGREYEEKIGYKADFYVVEIGNGPIILE